MHLPLNRGTANAYNQDSAADLSEASESEAEQEASGYEDEDASVEPSSPSSEDSQDYASEQEERRRSRKKARTHSRSTPITAPTSGAHAGQELWRPGVTTGLGPGTQVVIKKPKPRAVGATPYTNATIHPNTLLFLADLARHNDRAWLKLHDADFRASEADFRTYLGSVQERLVELDETIPELPAKDVVFRIYRDVRFSKDQTPYKTHFSAAWSRTGRKGPFAAYYVQIKAGGSFVGGGLWMPETLALARLRADVNRRPQRLKSVLMREDVRKEFLPGASKDERQLVKAFVGHNKENVLKTKPKGYEADHKDIELLRLRSYTMGRKFKNDEVLGDQGFDNVVETLRCLVPFVTYLNSVVMPDDPESSDEEEERAEGEGEEEAGEEPAEEQRDESVEDEKEDDED